jgi:hypothetical protein
VPRVGGYQKRHERPGVNEGFFARGHDRQERLR